MIIKSVMLLLLLVIAPVSSGLIFTNRMSEQNRSIGVSYLTGFLLLLAVFQLIAVPVVFYDPWGFGKIVKLFTALTAVVSGCGIIDSMHCFRKGRSIWKINYEFLGKNKADIIQWGTVAVLIFFQLTMAVIAASFDGDDAYYVVNSVITEETDTLYRILPYTGISTVLDKRHSMAVFPIWISYIARMTGIHPTILSHTVLPVFLISITYGIYYEIGKKLFEDKKTGLAAYMIFVCLLHIFGNVSIYTNATFLLTRNWQGKSVLANIVIPSIFLVLLWLFDENKGKINEIQAEWFLLFILNIVAAMMSTASVFLNSILIGVMALVLAFQKKDLKIILKLSLCCIPCIVYALFYIM